MGRFHPFYPIKSLLLILQMYQIGRPISPDFTHFSDIKIHLLNRWKSLTYFKPYKMTNKTLSGDVDIRSKFSFEALCEHTTLQTWFHQHGYGMILNDCQS
jgi:hypothetical protein